MSFENICSVADDQITCTPQLKVNAHLSDLGNIVQHMSQPDTA
jgi:hypothetical protein